MCAAFEQFVNGDMCATTWHELPHKPDVLVIDTPSYSVYTAPVRHSRPTCAVKITDHEREATLVYSSDTAPCIELEHFAASAHMLIHEATTDDPLQGYGHSTPYQAGEAAYRCGAKRLVLIQYSDRYTMPEAQALDDVRAAGFCGEALLARELDAYQL